MITITIPNFHPAKLNELLGGHWSKGHKRKKADRNLIATYTRHLKPATTKRRVHLTIVCPDERYGGDPDSYFKSLNDALVHSKQLVNDSKKWCELAPVQYRIGSKETIITLEDL